MIPGLRRHARGQWTVTLSGEPFYFRKDATKQEAEAWYDGLVARWLANGRRPLGTPRSREKGGTTVGDLTRLYREHVRTFYTKERPRGRKMVRELTTTGKAALYAMGVLDLMYGDLEIGRFGRTEFKTVRNHWTTGHNRYGKPARNCRKTINQAADAVKACFAWGAAEGIVPPLVLAEIAVVRHLRKGRCDHPEGEPVGPAPDDAVEAVIAACRPPMAAMIRLQRLTGMRPAEVCGMRRCHLDMEGAVWRYDVPDCWNKTAHHGHARTVWIGPQAQAVLKPYLDRQPSQDGPIFLNMFGRAFVTKAYQDAVTAHCKRLGVAHWTPNQLRHSAATEIARREALRGLDAAMKSLGHSDNAVTRRYVEDQGAVERRIAETMG